jgi:hypothetical protein
MTDEQCLEAIEAREREENEPQPTEERGNEPPHVHDWLWDDDGFYKCLNCTAHGRKINGIMIRTTE